MADYTKEMYAQQVAELKRHSKLYHKDYAPLISDAEYDSMFHEVRLIEREHPDWIDKTSPTQIVGEDDSSDGFRTMHHVINMYSLENLFTIADLRRYYKRFAELRHTDTIAAVDNYYCDYKMDGLSLELIYSRGRLVTALTRGTGERGTEVTQNAFMIANIPKYIRAKETVSIQGEVVVHKSDFYAFNHEQEHKNLECFSNPRNYAAGSLRQLDPEVTKSRILRFYAWSFYPLNAKEAIPRDKQISYLTEFGFNTPGGQLCHSLEEVVSFINETERIRSTLPYEIDGVVIKQNTTKYQKILGWNSHAPLWAAAWKFTADGLDTVIKDIHWSIGRTGKLTPIASIRPITLGGVTIRECSLYNADYVEKNKVGVNAKVHVIRSGDVIPKIETFISNGKYEDIPTTCPYCSEPLTRMGTDLRCTNHGCTGSFSAFLLYIAGKDVLNIKGIGPAVINELLQAKTVTSILDLFTPIISPSNKVSQDLLDKLVCRMQNINLLELLMILGIEHMGRAMAMKLAAEVETVQGFIDLFHDDLHFRSILINAAMKINLKKWYEDPYNQDLLEKIRDLNLPNCS